MVGALDSGPNGLGSSPIPVPVSTRSIATSIPWMLVHHRLSPAFCKFTGTYLDS